VVADLSKDQSDLPVVPHLSVTERRARGKAARREVPIETLGHYEPGDFRSDPVELLGRQETTRIPELVPIRHGRMLVSPLTFYRGAALVMAADLATLPSPGLRVQLCGDAHLSNFGVVASPERRLVFDLNDYDETSPGPFEWDVQRLVASLELAARERGFTDKERSQIVVSAAAAYRTAMREFAEQRNLAVWYARLEIDEIMNNIKKELRPDRFKATEEELTKTRTRDSLRTLDKLTHLVDGEPRFISDPPLIVPVEELLDADAVDAFYLLLHGLLRSYRSTLQSDRRLLLEEYRLVHLARKVVGVGSVGTRAWVMLLLGRNTRDPLVLQVKEAQASVLEDYAGANPYSDSGQRVVAGQHLMQATSDIFLGWQRVTENGGNERHYYVRQLHDWKASVQPERMRPKGMNAYGQLCGWTLARAHARSGDRVAIASYLGAKDRFEQAMVAFARTYADQDERDFEAMQAAAAEGRIEVVRGV
jgi:uncharacterized protein (DUF2252 family)